MVRYADDFVILCRSEQEAQEALARVRAWVEENGLTLHPEKSHVGDCRVRGQAFGFLGYLIGGRRRWVRNKSWKAIREKIRQKRPRSYGRGLKQLIAELNPMLRGWFEYFKHAHISSLRRLDGFIRRRIRAILRLYAGKAGRHGHSLNDHKRWPDAYFARQGLFTLAGAHAAACRSR